jgi:hypothetical protein
MIRLTSSAAVAAIVLTTTAALADNNRFNFSITSDRKESDLGVPSSTKLLVGGDHTFGNGLILGGSAEYAGTAFSSSATANLETTLAYRIRFDEVFSVTGSVGLGGHLQVQGSGQDFPYYVFRAAADVKLGDSFIWNAVAFRYRDGFSASDNFLTPQLATGLTYKIDEHNTVGGKIQYNWKDWNPDTIGFQIAYGHSF